MTEQVVSREYVDAAWTHKALDGIFAALSPSIVAEFAKAGRDDLGENYVAAIAQSCLVENLSPYLANINNQSIALVVDANMAAWNKAACGAVQSIAGRSIGK